MKIASRITLALAALGGIAFGAVPAAADSAPDFAYGATAGPSQELAPYLQCAPYARQISGIQLFGDARTWWTQAQGRYDTGRTPREGAVMTFRPHGSMELGHVAAVSRVIDSRTVLLDHANWSPVEGKRGQIERNVRAVDVSPANDWSAVRVWYHPLGRLGTTEWPVEGFIYPGKSRASPQRLAQNSAPQGPARLQSSRQFLAAFGSMAN